MKIHELKYHSGQLVDYVNIITGDVNNGIIERLTSNHGVIFYQIKGLKYVEDQIIGITEKSPKRKLI